MRHKDLIPGERYTVVNGGPLFPHLRGERVIALDAKCIRVVTGSAKGLELLANTFGLKRTGKLSVCRCIAYKWPHRTGGGVCNALSDPPFCGSCGQPCTTKLDYNRQEISYCCGSNELFQDYQLVFAWSPNS